MTKLIACLSAALLFLLAGAAMAQAATPDSQLLRTYQPVTHFDPQESFGPTSVQSFISDAALERLVAGQWVVVDPAPEPGELPGPGTGAFRLNQTSCSPSAPLGGLSCYQSNWDSGSGGSVVYGRVAHVPGATVLQYWYFYYDDLYSYFYPPSDAIWQAHEGDWEVVNVVLSADEQPLEVGYSQHCLGQRRAWATTPRWDGRTRSSTSRWGRTPTTWRRGHTRSARPASRRRCWRCWPSTACRCRTITPLRRAQSQDRRSPAGR